MNLCKLEAYPSKEALAEELRRLTIESEVKHHGCCQVIVQTFLEVLGVQNEALSMAASPFVGGLALTGNNCGAVIGGLMVLGAVFGRKELQEGMPGLLKGMPDRNDLRPVDLEPREEGGPPRLLEIDARRPVPDDVVGPQVLDQHEHIDRVHCRVHAAAEDGAHDIPGLPGQREPDNDLAEIMGDVRDARAGRAIGGEEVEAPAQEFGLQ